MKIMRRFLLGITCALIMSCTITNCVFAAETKDATRLDIKIDAKNGESTARLLDDSYSSKITFTADNPITVTAKDDSDLGGLYVIFDQPPENWTVTYDGGSIECGKNAFIHEYVSLPDGVKSATITFSRNEKLCDVKAYSKGILPDDVQVWKPSCEKADILLLSTHADDEILFFGGILPEYAGERELDVQLVYFSNYFTGTVIREHEKLDGLWTAGVRNYPVNGNFDDQYADDLKAAEKIFDYDKTLGFVVEQIRRFKPQVCVAQDTNGEYGHGTHQLTSKAMQEAVTISMEADRYPESATTYGTWDVKKTYIHLYKENPISLDCRKPLSRFGNKNALEVAKEAYKQHVSQQWCWFYVSDTYEYSIAEYGLMRSTVGVDTGNDIMENVVSYKEQQRLELEAKRKAREEEQEASRLAKEKHDQEEIYGVPSEEVSPDKIPNFLKNVGKNLLTVMGIAFIVITVIALISIAREAIVRRNKRRRRNRRKKNRKNME